MNKVKDSNLSNRELKSASQDKDQAKENGGAKPRSSQGIGTFVAGLLMGIFLATVIFSLVSRDEQDGLLITASHNLEEIHPVHLGMVRLAEVLAEKSGGQMQMKILPNGVMGTNAQTLEQLQSGAIDFAVVSAAPIESFASQYQIFGLPYLFKDSAHFWRVLDSSIGEDVLASGHDVGLIGMGYFDAGSRSFYFRNKLIQSPADLKGAKVRVMQSPTAMAVIKAMGGSPTPVAWGEVYTALQQGLVDGAENNPLSFLSNAHYEVAPHLSLDEHTSIPDVILASAQLWDRLDAQQRKWLQEATYQASLYQRQIWAEMTADALKQLKQEGVEITRPDKQLFVDLVAPLLGEHEGTQVGELVRQIQEMP